MKIVFEGELNGKARAFWIRKVRIAAAISSTIVLIPMWVGAIWICLKVQPFVLFALIPYLVLTVMTYFAPSKKEQLNTFPIYISLDREEGIILAKSQKRSASCSINSLDRVIDYGECYQIVSPFSKVSLICQKDLITQGSIEDFEQIFAGKIIRKTK